MLKRGYDLIELPLDFLDFLNSGPEIGGRFVDRISQLRKSIVLTQPDLTGEVSLTDHFQVLFDAKERAGEFLGQE
jgi:hypothetical protein